MVLDLEPYKLASLYTTEGAATSAIEGPVNSQTEKP